MKHWEPVAKEAAVLSSDKDNVRSQERHATTLVVLGSSLLQLRRKEEAVDLFDEAVRFYPDDNGMRLMWKMAKEMEDGKDKTAKAKENVVHAGAGTGDDLDPYYSLYNPKINSRKWERVLSAMSEEHFSELFVEWCEFERRRSVGHYGFDEPMADLHIRVMTIELKMNPTLPEERAWHAFKETSKSRFHAMQGPTRARILVNKILVNDHNWRTGRDKGREHYSKWSDADLERWLRKYHKKLQHMEATAWRVKEESLHYELFLGEKASRGGDIFSLTDALANDEKYQDERRLASLPGAAFEAMLGELLDRKRVEKYIDAAGLDFVLRYARIEKMMQPPMDKNSKLLGPHRQWLCGAFHRGVIFISVMENQLAQRWREGSSLVELGKDRVTWSQRESWSDEEFSRWILYTKNRVNDAVAFNMQAPQNLDLLQKERAWRKLGIKEKGSDETSALAKAWRKLGVRGKGSAETSALLMKKGTDLVLGIKNGNPFAGDTHGCKKALLVFEEALFLTPLLPEARIFIKLCQSLVSGDLESFNHGITRLTKRASSVDALTSRAPVLTVGELAKSGDLLPRWKGHVDAMSEKEFEKRLALFYEHARRGFVREYGSDEDTVDLIIRVPPIISLLHPLLSRFDALCTTFWARNLMTEILYKKTAKVYEMLMKTKSDELYQLYVHLTMGTLSDIERVKFATQHPNLGFSEVVWKKGNADWSHSDIARFINEENENDKRLGGSFEYVEKVKNGQSQFPIHQLIDRIFGTKWHSGFEMRVEESKDRMRASLSQEQFKARIVRLDAQNFEASRYMFSAHSSTMLRTFDPESGNVESYITGIKRIARLDREMHKDTVSQNSALLGPFRSWWEDALNRGIHYGLAAQIPLPEILDAPDEVLNKLIARYDKRRDSTCSCWYINPPYQGYVLTPTFPLSEALRVKGFVIPETTRN